MPHFGGRRIWTKKEDDPYVRLATAVVQRAVKDLRLRPPKQGAYRWRKDRQESVAFFRRRGDVFDSICAVADADSDIARRGIEQRTGMTLEEWEEECSE